MKFVLALVCFASTAAALPIDFIHVVDGQTMPRSEVRRVISGVKKAYDSLHLARYGAVIKWGRLRSKRVGFGPGEMKDRLAYSYRLLKRLRQKRPVYVFVPMSTDGYSWGYCLSRAFAVGTATSVNLRGEDRYLFSVTTAVHEIGHMLGQSHSDNEANIMHSDALRFVTDRIPPWGWWARDMILWFGFGIDICRVKKNYCLEAHG